MSQQVLYSVYGNLSAVKRQRSLRKRMSKDVP